MSRNAKIVVIIVGTVVAMCCMYGVASILLAPKFFENSFAQNPQKAREVASQIADYKLPMSYSEGFSMDLFTTKMVMIAGPSSRGLTFMFMQFATPGASREQLEAQMRQSFQQQFQTGTGTMTQVGTQEVIIKGQRVTFTIFESTASSDRLRIRQETGVFPGKGGTAMLMISGLTSEWDDGLVGDFLNSIH